MTIWHILLLAACGGGSGDDTAAADADTDAYVVGEDEIDWPDPSFDAEGLADAAAEGFAAARAVQAAPLVKAYADLLETADSTCPSWYSAGEFEYWVDSCTSRDGTSFDGYGVFVEAEAVDDGSGVLWDTATLFGAGTLTDEDGHSFRGTGAAGWATGEAAGGVYAWVNTVEGSFDWDGAGSSGTWLEDSLNPGLTMIVWSVPAVDARVVALEGSVGGLDSTLDTVVFDGMVLATAAAGSPCPDEPSGTLSIRDADGHWTDILFDVPWDAATSTFGVMDDAACDGCGAAWFRGQYLGEACVDASVLLDWEESPW